MKFSPKMRTVLGVWGIVLVGMFSFTVFLNYRAGTQIRLFTLRNDKSRKESIEQAREAPKSVPHIQRPDAVKGIYITAATASISKFDKLLDLIDRTELNTVVLDLKDWKQRPAFTMQRESLKPYNVSDPVIRNLDALIKKVHGKNIYLIGRIATFQDQYLVGKKPEWALHSKRGGEWHDRKGVTWLDSTQRAVWDYNVELAREAYARGFDEINFDYVRFPSDGVLDDIVYASYDGKTDKSLEMRKFFSYLDHELRSEGIPISVDLFGLTMGNEDGLGIGQRFRDAAPFFDTVSPMVYPSHYAPNSYGFKNPADHPYEVINHGMSWGVSKLKELSSTSTVLNASGKPLATLRPWLQDFNLGARYDAAMVSKEVKATYDAGLGSWLLWNAGNNYTDGALAPIK